MSPRLRNSTHSLINGDCRIVMYIIWPGYELCRESSIHFQAWAILQVLVIPAPVAVGHYQTPSTAQCWVTCPQPNLNVSRKMRITHFNTIPNAMVFLTYGLSLCTVAVCQSKCRIQQIIRGRHCFLRWHTEDNQIVFRPVSAMEMMYLNAERYKLSFSKSLYYYFWVVGLSVEPNLTSATTRR